MKTADRNSAKTSPAPSFYTFLKPGALAQLRYSKMAARSKQTKAQTLLALSQLESISGSLFSPEHPIPTMDGIPCFNSKVKCVSLCLRRKKLVAVTPFFTGAQS